MEEDQSTDQHEEPVHQSVDSREEEKSGHQLPNDDNQLMEQPTDANPQPACIIQVVEPIEHEESSSHVMDGQVDNSLADGQVIIESQLTEGQDGHSTAGQEVDGQMMGQVVTQLTDQHANELSGQAVDQEQDVSIVVTDDKDGQEVTRAAVTNDQEMGLAVAILELIGSQPHIAINPPTEGNAATTTDQQQSVDISLKDNTQQEEQNSTTAQSVDISQEHPYPIALGVTTDQQQDRCIVVTPDDAIEVYRVYPSNDEGMEQGSLGQGGDEPKKEEQEKGEKEGAKRKRGRPRKKKGNDEQGKKSKKSKKENKKDDDATNTSEDAPDKEKKVSAPKNFLCVLCSAAFNRKDNLKVHCRIKHNTEILDTSTKTKCLNPQCDKTFYHKTQMLHHMEQEHGLNVQKKEIEFQSLEAFKKWKVEEETSKFVFFSSYRGPSANKNGKDKHLYFKCQKDGPDRAHRRLGEPRRKTERRNKKGSVKTGLLCPARMICKVNGKTGKVVLTYIYSHAHTITPSDTEHQPVPKLLKKDLMEKLALGTPVRQLYKDLRKETVEQGGGGSKAGSPASSTLPVHHVSQRTLELMKHRVDMNRRLHCDESTSILLLVDKLKDEPYNVVLLYKPQGSVAVVGDESLKHLPFADDLSVLALQTEEQMKVLKQRAPKVIYMDTTHSTNPSDLKLMSLVVPDSQQQGYAVAHLVANRIDEHLLYYFVKAIKERCEGFEPSVIMTDEDKTGFGVFQAVYPGVAFTHLLSKWHVHRGWLKRLNRDIPNVELKQEMYHCLVLMLEEQNISKFNEMASSFVSHYSTKSATFTEYFVELYRSRPESWAMCFRNSPDSVKTDDVIFMTNFHSNLKAFFGQKRKNNKRIDALVHILLDNDRDDAWRRVKKAFQDGHNDPECLSHHEKGMVIPEDQVGEIGEQDTSWLVSSFDDQDVKHQVKKLIDVCVDDNCHLKCLELSCFSLCHHLYECTCFDEVNICQHIHRVHSIRVAQLQVPQSLQCTPAADLGAYVEIHYMDEEETVGIATQNIQTSEIAATNSIATTEDEETQNVATSGDSPPVGMLQSRLQHLVNLLGSRQVDDILLNHVSGTVDQLITSCEEAANNAPAETQS